MGAQRQWPESRIRSLRQAPSGKFHIGHCLGAFSQCNLWKENLYKSRKRPTDDDS